MWLEIVFSKMAIKLIFWISEESNLLTLIFTPMCVVLVTNNDVYSVFSKPVLFNRCFAET